MLELGIGIAYDSEINTAIDAIRTALVKLDGLSGERTLQIGIAEFGDSAIEINARLWVQTRRFHEVRFAANHVISKALEAAGISIPFPQRVVRIETEDTR